MFFSNEANKSDNCSTKAICFSVFIIPENSIEKIHTTRPWCLWNSTPDSKIPWITLCYSVNAPAAAWTPGDPAVENNWPLSKSETLVLLLPVRQGCFLYDLLLHVGDVNLLGVAVEIRDQRLYEDKQLVNVLVGTEALENPGHLVDGMVELRGPVGLEEETPDGLGD